MLIFNNLKTLVFFGYKAVIKVIEIVDLTGDAFVPADRALKLFSQRELEVHLGTIETDDASARTVHAHRVASTQNIQSMTGLCVRNVACALVTGIFVRSLIPQTCSRFRHF